MSETHLASLQEPTDAEQLADAAVALWRDVWSALSPIIGAAGVAALFQRSIFLRVAEYPWLTNVSDTPRPDVFNDFRQEQHAPGEALLRWSAPPLTLPKPFARQYKHAGLPVARLLGPRKSHGQRL